MSACTTAPVSHAQTAFTVLIPARMTSTRLPDKPLADIGGLPMVVRVARQASASRAQQVIVATDDGRIAQVCDRHGVACIMTASDHRSGSDRLAEAAAKLALDDNHLVVNVQGDEPWIPPALIDAVADVLAAHPEAVMGTAAHPIASPEDFHNPNVVKVVLRAGALAQYFSRAPIPFPRDGGWPAPAACAGATPLRHIGIYSYRARFLRAFPALQAAPTEQVESLEQLRVLWHGHQIAVHITEQAPPPGVDTPDDLARARAWLHSHA